MTRHRDATFSRRSLKWLRSAVATFLNSESGKTAKLWIAGLLLLMLLMNGMNVVNSYVLRDFMSAIQNRDHSGFVSYAWLYAGVFAVSTIFSVLLRFSEERLGLLWRDWMTRWLTTIYMDGKLYLHLQNDRSLTNPDQRIQEDVKALTVTTLSLIIMITNSTITVLSFSGVLWAISPTLFLVAVAYALLGSSLTVFLGRPLVQLNYQQADFEADFRADLVQVHQLAEGIALAGFQGRTRDRLLNRISAIVGNFRRIVAVNRNVGFFTTGYNYLIQLVPIVIVAPLFIREGVDFGVIGQSAMAFSTLVAALSLIVTQIQSISAYASVLKRLGEFGDAATHTTACRDAACITCEDTSDRFIFEDVTLRSTVDEQQVLVANLTMTFEKGVRILITGNKAAQQAMFRATACMPVVGTGRVIRPPAEKIAFLPENPFLPPGTLREALVASEHDQATSNEEIWSVLKAVGIDEVIARHDAGDLRRNWHDILTFKDEQLMVIARAILFRPDFAILGQLTSSLKPSTERRILRLMHQRGITCISICDQLPNPEIHDRCLELGDEGQWQLIELKEPPATIDIAG